MFGGGGGARGAADEEHDLWPENERAWAVWHDVQTQWRSGVGGISGLDYAGVRAWIDELGLTPEDRRDVWSGIRACERAVLEVHAEPREPRQGAMR